jgi:hypothetical protein
VVLREGSDELFCFENICETLGLHPDHIRKGLLVWKKAKLPRATVKRPSTRLSKTAYP